MRTIARRVDAAAVDRVEREVFIRNVLEIRERIHAVRDVRRDFLHREQAGGVRGDLFVHVTESSHHDE